VSNEKVIFKSLPNSIISPLGIEFSSNGRLLYFTETIFPGPISAITDTNIHQVDLNAFGNPSGRVTIYGKNTTYGVLQLGPDGRIYCPVNRGRDWTDPDYVIFGYLDVIECPNNVGEANLRTNSFPLYDFNRQPPNPRSIYRCIPQFIQSYFKEQQPIIEMPNVFTPNNDEFNPVFKPVDINLVRSASLKIFNRWGAVVYETNDPFLGWDGGEFETGVYYWLIDAVGTSCQPATRKGWLQLIR
jgi:gliding motility-associated-like protein